MSNLLDHITTIEINTVIVDEIVDEIFIPWEVYQAIYYISRSTLEAEGVPLALGDRYLNLRRQLELQYSLLSLQRNSHFYNRRQRGEIKKNLALLISADPRWESLPTRLPQPLPKQSNAQSSKLDLLLEDRQFVALLRRLGKIKNDLDWRVRRLRQNPQSIINKTYAQTTMSFNGEITNRYTQQILQHRDRSNLLYLHNQSVAAATKHWQGLLKLAIDFLPSLAKVGN